MPKDYFFFIELLLIISYPKKQPFNRTIKLSKRWEKLHLDAREKKSFNFWPCKLEGAEKTKDPEDALLTSVIATALCPWQRFCFTQLFPFTWVVQFNKTVKECKIWGPCNGNKKFYLTVELFTDTRSSNLTTCITEVWINSGKIPFLSWYSMLS